MLTKLLSLLASFLMLFSPCFPAEEPLFESGPVLKEPVPAANALRTCDTIHGVGDSVFYIQRPSTETETVCAADFGMDAAAADNYPALCRALEYCRTHPGTRLELEPGEYYLDNQAPLTMNGFRDVCIDGNGATLIFSNVVTGFVLYGCDCVEFRNIRFDWDWEKRPLSDIVTVRNVSPKTGELDLEFLDREPDENAVIAALSQCDPQSYTYGAKGSNKEVYVYQKPSCITDVRKTDARTLHITHDGCLRRFANGETFILRYYVYDTTFTVLNGESRNITFDTVSVFGYPGAGFFVGEKSSHFQWVNCYIGTNPDCPDRRTSLAADAIHIVNSDGCFRIEGCDISGQGDDALNVHDGLGWVKGVDGNKITLLANALYLRRGDTLRFLDENYADADCTAVVTDLSYHAETTTYTLTLDKNVDGAVATDYIVYNLNCDSGNYVVRGNYIHENRARGLLMQSDNGLCENNRFYKTEMQAIKIIMDISPGLWYEGTGADRLVIRNNTFTECDYIATGEVITIGSNIAGKSAVTQPFTNIDITGNRFSDFPGRVLLADNVNGLQFSGNTIEADRGTAARVRFGKHCSNIRFADNTWKNTFLGSIAVADSFAVWARVNHNQSGDGSVIV